jgi:hypothetical protein
MKEPKLSRFVDMQKLKSNIQESRSKQAAYVQMPQKYLQKGQGRIMWLKPLPVNDLQHLWAVFHMFSLPIEQISRSHVAELYYSMQYKTHDEPGTSD